jgi:streptomycin 6-kinase
LLAVLADSGELDGEKARGWAIVRCVDYWLWGLEHGLTEDPKRCRRILAALT